MDNLKSAESSSMPPSKCLRLIGKKMAGKKWFYLLPPIFLPPFRRQTDSLTEHLGPLR
jgi:hypothetical protein